MIASEVETGYLSQQDTKRKQRSKSELKNFSDYSFTKVSPKGRKVDLNTIPEIGTVKININKLMGTETQVAKHLKTHFKAATSLFLKDVSTSLYSH